MSEISRKIFLDRYALKDLDKDLSKLSTGDLLLVRRDKQTENREIATVAAVYVNSESVLVKYADEELENQIIHRDQIEIPLETTQAQMWDRLATATANTANEKTMFRWALDDNKFVPGGRILSSMGAGKELTAFNCYVLPNPKDTIDGIFDSLRNMTKIMKSGGGVGLSLSALRPRLAYLKKVNGRSSGSVSWGSIFSTTCALVSQGGSRRGSLMLCLSVSHPDVIEFINCKRTAGKVTSANISVAISDKFMQAVAADGDWIFEFPDTSVVEYKALWDGDLEDWRDRGLPIKQYDTMKAKTLWNLIIESAWSSAEPGILFMERSNKDSNSWYYAPLVATNPCAEQPLTGNAVCLLGHVNLAKMIDPKFHKCKTATEAYSLIHSKTLSDTVSAGIRFLDNVTDKTFYPLPENEAQQKSERRIGFGTFGLAELLIRLGLRYGSEEGNKLMDMLYRFIQQTAYMASAVIAKEKGAFPSYTKQFLESGFMKKQEPWLREIIEADGIRNVTLITQAPCGTTATMCGTSTGIEPFYNWTFWRQGRLGTFEQRVSIVDEYMEQHNLSDVSELPDYFVTAQQLSPAEHVSVQAVIQKHTDSSISKTVNCPSDFTVDQVREVYEMLYSSGCKGGTIYRDKSRDQQVLHNEKPEEEMTFVDSSVGGVSVKTTTKAVIKPTVYGLQSFSMRKTLSPRSGVTYTKKTPVGTAHVTINYDAEGNLHEMFINVGKAGSDITGLAEFIARLVSDKFQTPYFTDEQKLDALIKQCEGIGGFNMIGMGPTLVRSLPDAIAQVLKEHRYHKKPSLPVESLTNGHAYATVAIRSSDACPRCSNFTMIQEAGCSTCQNCGHSGCA